MLPGIATLLGTTLRNCWIRDIDGNLSGTKQEKRIQPNQRTKASSISVLTMKIGVQRRNVPSTPIVLIESGGSEKAEKLVE